MYGDLGKTDAPCWYSIGTATEAPYTGTSVEPAECMKRGWTGICMVAGIIVDPAMTTDEDPAAVGTMVEPAAGSIPKPPTGNATPADMEADATDIGAACQVTVATLAL